MPQPSESDIQASFAVLQIEPNSDWQTVKSAYRKLVREWHPDLQHNQKEAAEAKIRQINRAYTLLRKHYQFSLTRTEHGFFDDKHSTRSKDHPFSHSQTIISITLDAVKRYATHRNGGDNTHSFAAYCKEQMEWMRQLATAILSRKQIKWILIGAPLTIIAFYTTLSILKLEVDAPPITVTNTHNTKTIGHFEEDKKPGKQGLPLKSVASKDFITVGDNMVKVLETLGPPTASSATAWYYGQSAIFLKEGFVVSWYIDPSRPLNVREPGQAIHFLKKGLDKNMVLALLGPPTEMKTDRWYYGSSMVHFEEGLVADWYNSKSSPLHSFVRQ